MNEEVNLKYEYQNAKQYLNRKFEIVIDNCLALTSLSFLTKNLNGNKTTEENQADKQVVQVAVD